MHKRVFRDYLLGVCFESPLSRMISSICNVSLDTLNGNKGQEREGGNYKNTYGRTTLLHMWTHLGRDWRRTDGFHVRRATLDFKWNSQPASKQTNSKQHKCYLIIKITSLAHYRKIRCAKTFTIFRQKCYDPAWSCSTAVPRD